MSPRDVFICGHTLVIVGSSYSFKKWHKEMPVPRSPFHARGFGFQVWHQVPELNSNNDLNNFVPDFSHCLCEDKPIQLRPAPWLLDLLQRDTPTAYTEREFCCMFRLPQLIWEIILYVVVIPIVLPNMSIFIFIQPRPIWASNSEITPTLEKKRIQILCQQLCLKLAD